MDVQVKKQQEKKKIHDLSDILNKEEIKKMLKESENNIKKDMKKR